MSFNYKHNLDGIIQPEHLADLFDKIAKSGMEDDLVNAPFVRVEYKGSDRFISFWSPKDTLTSGEGDVDMGMSYCRYFLKICLRHKSFALLPLIVAEMAKNGEFGEVEIVFIEYLVEFMVMGFAVYNLACWISDMHGGLGHPDFSWLVTTPKK